jgi:hypothetical protein
MHDIIDLTNFEKIGKKIYVYKNFLLEDELKFINNLIDKITDWVIDPNRINTMHDGNIWEVDFITPRIQNLLQNGYYAMETRSVNRMLPGMFWESHSDVHDFEEIEKLAEEYDDGDDYVEKVLPVFGTIVYFRLPKQGGHLYYPTQNIQYMPSAGDLVIHGSGPDCEHGVAPIINGVRYAAPSNIYKYVKIKKNKNDI